MEPANPTLSTYIGALEAAESLADAATSPLGRDEALHWDRFVGWCERELVDPETAPLNVVGLFLRTVQKNSRTVAADAIATAQELASRSQVEGA